MKFTLKLVLMIGIAWIGSAWAQLSQSESSAYDIWLQLKAQGNSFHAEPLQVNGAAATVDANGNLVSQVTFGAEKEGSSSRILKVMGPDATEFNRMMSNHQDGLASFLDDLVNGSIAVDNVVDIDGNKRVLDLTEFKGTNFHVKTVEELQNYVTKIWEKVDQRLFSFVKTNPRSQLYRDYFAPKIQDRSWQSRNRFESWVPHFGKPEKYIYEGYTEINNGWELKFRPQQTYGEFEEMVDWFRKTMGVNNKLFEAPGHQRIVFKVPQLEEAARKVYAAKVNELIRSSQSYLLIKGLEGKSGIHDSKWNNILTDAIIKDRSSYRAPIRIEENRFGENTLGLEIRTGTKNKATRTVVEQSLVARLSASDMQGLSSIYDYDLFVYIDDLDIEQRFELPEGSQRKITEKIEDLFKNGMSKNAYTPFYLWENAPYVSETKKKMLMRLSKQFAMQILDEPNLTASKLKSMYQSWAKASNLSRDIEAYISPLKNASLGSEQTALVPIRVGGFDVNKIDLGIEYSGRFPLRLDANYTETLEHGKKEWINTVFDMTDAERRQSLESVAKSLHTELNGIGEVINVPVEGGHGHGLGIAYEFEDSLGRNWRVEWDGIGRSYTAAGGVKEGSSRAGHIELVTPKFEPTYEEMKKVFKAFDDNGIIPSSKMGGGHINIDLAAFKGQPKKLAKFMALFHEYRDVMAMMFQDPGRQLAADAVEVSSDLQRKLMNFNGTEDELKALLYNEKYFNTRVGRKSRYVQLDMSAFFQDVIPEQFLHADFDIANPSVVWRQQFRVNPKIRKMEFRMFNAPLSAYESALQVKFVRAMLNEALNEDSSLSGAVADLDFDKMHTNQDSVRNKFRQMCQKLGLDEKQYQYLLEDGFYKVGLRKESSIFVPYQQKIQQFPKVGGWGQAVPARGAEQAIKSELRVWQYEHEGILNKDGSLKKGVSKQAQDHYLARQKALMSAEEKSVFFRDGGKRLLQYRPCELPYMLR